MWGKDQWLFWAALAAAWSGASCQRSPAKSEQQPFGETRTVDRGAIGKEIAASGFLTSLTSVPVYAPKLSRYWEFNVSWAAPEGAQVKKGETIIRLDDSQIQKDLDLAQIKLESSQLKQEEEKIRVQDLIESDRADVELAALEVEKQKLLVTEGDSVAQNETKKQKIQVTVAQNSLVRAKEKAANNKQESDRKLAAGQLELQQTQDEVEELRAGLSQMEIKAPQDGLLVYPFFFGPAGTIKVRQGVKVQINAVIAEVHDMATMAIKLFLPEIDLDGITAGGKGAATFNYAPERSYPGEVATIANIPSTPAERQGRPAAEAGDNVKQFEMVFRCPELPEKAVPGMSAQVMMGVVQKTDVVRLPLDALALSPPVDHGALTPLGADATNGAAYVYLRKKGGSNFHWEKVMLGAYSYSYAEVTDGVAEGDSYRMILW